MFKLPVFFTVTTLLIGCSNGGDDVEPYIDTDTIDMSGCLGLDAGTDDWPSDGGVPVLAFLGNGDELVGSGNEFGEFVNDIAAFEDDSFVVAGSFIGKAVFGEGQPGETELRVPPYGGMDGFIAKYQKTGEFEWVRHLTSPYQLVDRYRGDWVISIDTFSDSSFVIRGEFTKELTLALGEENETKLETDEKIDPIGEFMAHYGTNGDLIWAKVLAAGQTSVIAYEDEPAPKSMAILSDHYILTVGEFEDNVRFGPGQKRKVRLSTDGYIGYLAKWDGNGEILWAIPQGSRLLDHLAVATVCDGHILVTGKFEGQQKFGQTPGLEVTFGESMLGSFVARYYPNGELKHAYIYGKTVVASGGLSVFPDRSYIIAARAGPGGNVVLFPGTSDQQNLGYHETSFLVVSRMDENDRPIWTATGAGSIRVYSVTALPDGSSIITGSFLGEAIFGEGEENETILVGYGIGAEPPYKDGFVARYFSDGRLAWARAINGVDSMAWVSDDDAVRAAAVLEGSRKVVIGGQAYGNFAIDYGTEYQWPPEGPMPPTGIIDWYVAILEL
ncbi:MAG: hypothetical protein QNJ97_16625 [Myxococcota bacterium]|nr:hypothetical protein [Myxococcota bacterium]